MPQYKEKNKRNYNNLLNDWLICDIIYMVSLILQ